MNDHMIVQRVSANWWVGRTTGAAFFAYNLSVLHSKYHAWNNNRGIAG